MEEIYPPELVRAGFIREGGCFRKKTGTYIYLRISESSLIHLLGEAYKPHQIYGVCLYNGNLAMVDVDQLVWPETVGFTKRYK